MRNPEQISSYIPELRALFSGELLSQAVARTERMASEVNFGSLHKLAVEYLANYISESDTEIVQFLRFVDEFMPKLICPRHGVCFSGYEQFVEIYRERVQFETEKTLELNQVTIIYGWSN